MRGAGDDADLLALEIFGPDLRHHRVLARGEARRHAVIGIGEVDAGAELRAHRHRGNDGIAPVGSERVHQRLEAAHLHRAGDLDLLTQRAGEIDVEAGRIAVGAGVVEGRIVGLGQETDHGQTRQVRPLRPPPRVPEAGHGLRGRLGSRLRCGFGRPRKAAWPESGLLRRTGPRADKRRPPAQAGHGARSEAVLPVAVRPLAGNERISLRSEGLIDHPAGNASADCG
ncbi:hypothetical protein ACVWWP_008167 [Bradyrhizobium sp. LM3.6]